MYRQPSLVKPVVITALVTVVATSVLWIGIGALGYWFVYREPPRLEVAAEYPEVVEVGEVFKVKVAVENGGARNIRLGNLDLYDDLIDGFEVVSVDPKPSSTDKLFGYISYNYYRNLKPAETLEIELELRAKEVGFWGGDIDACTVMQNFVTHYTEIEVLEAGESEEGAE